jgi:transcription elongation factor SPT6
MSARDLIMGEAEVDDESNDESFDDETGEPSKRKPNGTNGHLEDDSSEEEEDDDEEEAEKVETLKGIDRG